MRALKFITEFIGIVITSTIQSALFTIFKFVVVPAGFFLAVNAAIKHFWLIPTFGG